MVTHVQPILQETIQCYLTIYFFHIIFKGQRSTRADSSACQTTQLMNTIDITNTFQQTSLKNIKSTP